MPSSALEAFHRLLIEAGHLPPAQASGYGFTGNVGGAALRAVLAENERLPVMDENDIFDRRISEEFARRLDRVREYLAQQSADASRRFDPQIFIERIKRAAVESSPHEPETSVEFEMPRVVTSAWLDERGGKGERQYVYLLNRLRRRHPDFDPILPSKYFLPLGLDHSTMKRFRNHPYPAEIQRVAEKTGINPAILAWFAMEEELAGAFDVTPLIIEDRGEPAQKVLIGAVTMVPAFRSLFRDIDEMLREAHTRQLVPRKNQSLVAAIRLYAESRNDRSFAERHVMRRQTLHMVARFLAATFSTEEKTYTYDDMLRGLGIFFGDVVNSELVALYDPHQDVFVMPQSFDPAKEIVLSQNGQSASFILRAKYIEDAFRIAASRADGFSSPHHVRLSDNPFDATVAYWEQNKARLRREFEIVCVQTRKTGEARTAEIGGIVMPAGITDLSEDVLHALEKFRRSHGGRWKINKTLRTTIAALKSKNCSQITSANLAELAGRLALHTTISGKCLRKEAWLAILRVFTNEDGITDFLPVFFKNGTILKIPPHLELVLEKDADRVDTADPAAPPVRSLTDAVRAVSGALRLSATEMIRKFTAARIIEAIHICIDSNYENLNGNIALSVLEILAKSPATYGTTENDIVAAAAHMLYAMGKTASFSYAERAARVLADIGHPGFTPDAVIAAFPATRPNWSPTHVRTALSGLKVAAKTAETAARQIDRQLNLVPYIVSAVEVIDALERRSASDSVASALLRDRTLQLCSASDLDCLIEGGNFRFGITRNGKIVVSLLRFSPKNLREAGAKIHGAFRFSLSNHMALFDILTVGNAAADRMAVIDAFKNVLGLTAEYRRNLITDEGGEGSSSGGAMGGMRGGENPVAGHMVESRAQATGLSQPPLPLITSFSPVTPTTCPFLPGFAFPIPI